MDKDKKLELIKRKTRQRFWFCGCTLLLYYAFALNWTEAGSFLTQGISGSLVTGSLVMFALLIVIFIGLEMLFLHLYKKESEQQEQ